MISDANLVSALSEINRFRTSFEGVDLFYKPEPILEEDRLTFVESQDSCKTQEEVVNYVLRKFQEIAEACRKYSPGSNELQCCDFEVRSDCRRILERTFLYFDVYAQQFGIKQFGFQAWQLKDAIEVALLSICWDGVYNKLKTIKNDLSREAVMASNDIRRFVFDYRLEVPNLKYLVRCFKKIDQRLCTMNNRLQSVFTRLKTLDAVVPKFPNPLLMISAEMKEKLELEFESINKEAVKIFLSIADSYHEIEDVWNDHFDVPDYTVFSYLPGNEGPLLQHKGAIRNGTSCLEKILNNEKSTQVLIIFAAVSLVAYQQDFLKYYKSNKNQIDDPRASVEWHLAEKVLKEVREDDRLLPYLENPSSMPKALEFESKVWYLKDIKIKSLRRLRRMAQKIDIYKNVLKNTKDILMVMTHPSLFQARIFGDKLLM